MWTVMLRISITLLALVLTILPATAQTIRILTLGDSLAAGAGLDAGEAFPAKLEAALRARGHDVSVINAGVSGDTMAQGEARLDWALADKPNAVIVELGANDMLRGLEPQQMEQALKRILAALQQRNLPVLVAGMRAAPNLGPDYQAQFDPVFARQAEAHGALLYPFFLEGVAAEASLNQPDGLHPNEKGVDMIVEKILPAVEELLRRVQ
jgi:acyl-CoA thioesterase-1